MRIRSLILLLPVVVCMAGHSGAFAAGSAPQPNICTRACWGASASSAASQMSALTRAIVHHTAGSEFNTTSFEASKAYVRAIQNLHKNNGWGDIGYHFLVDKFGNIFEGRLGSMTSLPRGAHDAANTNSFGFTFMGYFHPNVNNSPTQAMLDAAYAVIAWRMPNGWTPYGSPGGTYGNLGNTVGRVDGHRRVVATACPGDLLYNPYIGTNLNAGVMRDQINQRINGAPPVFGQVSVLRAGDGRRTLFAVARGNGSVWHTWQTSPGSGFVPWVSLGGSGFTKVQAFYIPGSEAMVLYGIGNGSPLWQMWQTVAGGSWSAWTSLGGTITDFDVVYGTNNLPVAFAVSGGGLWHKWQTAAGGSWSAWTSLGGSGFTRIQGYLNNSNPGSIVFNVFGCGNGSPLWQAWQTSPGGSWSALTSLGGSIKSFEVVKSASNLPVAYAIGADTAVHTNWQPAVGSSWNGWVSLGGSGHSRLDADILPNGAGIFFSMGEGSPVWQRWQSAPGSSWSAWTSLGGAMSTIAASRAPDGAFSLFAHGSGNSNIWNSWQTAPGSPYAAWVSLGSGF